MTINNPFQTNTIPTTPITLSSAAYQSVQALRKRGQLSRTAIADEIGYSPSKITSVVNTLITKQIIAEQDGSTYTGGRRARDLFFNPDFGYLLSIGINKDTLDIALVDFSEQVRLRRMIPIATQATPSFVLQTMADFVAERLNRFDIALDRVLGVGLTLPGAIDPLSGQLFETSVLPQWGGYQILSFLRERFPHSVIKIEKDANAMAFAALRKGRGIGYDHIIYVSLEDSVRAGLILNGQMYRGISGRAGDLGDMLLPIDNTLKSLNTIVDEVPLAMEETLQSQALEGDVQAKTVIETSGQLLGQALANLSTLLDPQIILIGGTGVHLNHPFLAAVRRSFLDYAQSFKTQNLQIELASLKDASLLGIVALTAESIFTFDP
ncbi:MAG: ROK family protein [Anaerolineae bacterium]